MRGCVRSCSRRQRRPQHHLQPSAGPAFACPSGSVAATVSPKQLPLHGQVNLCGRLLFFFLLFQLLLLPLPSCSRKPLTPLTPAQLYTVSSAQLSLAPRAPPRRWTIIFYFWPSCNVPATSLCLASVPPPCSLLPALRPSAPAGQWRSPPLARAHPRPRRADDAEDALI